MCGPTTYTVVARDSTHDAAMQCDFGPPIPESDKNCKIKIENGNFSFFGTVAARNLPVDAKFVPGSMYYMQVGNRFHEVIFNLDHLYNFETGQCNVVEDFDYTHSPNWQVGVLGQVMQLHSTCCLQVSNPPPEAQGASWWGKRCGYLDRFYRMGRVSILRSATGAGWQYVHGCGAVRPFQVEGDFQGYVGSASDPTALVFTHHTVLLQ